MGGWGVAGGPGALQVLGEGVGGRGSELRGAGKGRHGLVTRGHCGSLAVESHDGFEAEEDLVRSVQGGAD